MAIVTDRKDGLFPGPREIKLNCSCPDWAGLCKHLAAILYGVGARLDDCPELLFKLRGVDHAELIQTDTAALIATGGKGGRRRLASAALGDVFGIDLDENEDAVSMTPVALKRSTSRRSSKNAAKKGRPKKIAAKKAVSPRQRPTRRPAKSPAKKAPLFRATGTAVSRLRERLGLSRSAFARQLGVSGPTIANWEAKSGKLSLQSRSLTALRNLHRSVHSG